MAELIIMPKLGFNMREGKLVAWYKKKGETVVKGEPLFSVETDKTNIDIDATADGVVRELFLEEGDTLPVTLPIAIVAGAEEDIKGLVAEAKEKLAGFVDVAEAEAPAQETAAAAGEKAEDDASYDFDIIVIGGGPGGYVAAIKAAQMGKKTAIIEKNRFGGTCLNVGCIPTKALIKSAEVFRTVKESLAFGVAGVDPDALTIDMAKVQARKGQVVNQLVSGVEMLLRKNGVKAIAGTAEVKDAHTVLVDGKPFTTADLILATGSKTTMLPIPMSEGMNILTSTEALALTEVPEEMVIIGGGVIGMEFAYLLTAMGTKVTVLEFLDRILPMVDEEITQSATRQMEALGMTIVTGAKVTEITDTAVVYEKDGARCEVATKMVLMAVGRGPNIEGIDTEALGLVTERGAIKTNERLETSVPHIYAIGDVNGRVMLAHTSSMEGIVAVRNICGEKTAMDYDHIPSVIYIQPEIASVGMTEAQARIRYDSIKVGRFPLIGNGKAKIEGETNGMIKVIAEAKYGEIVGVHMQCVHAADMIAEAALSMKLEATAEEVAMTVHPHPSISEIMQEAMHAVDGSAIHF